MGGVKGHGYGLSDAQAQALVDAGKDVCDYFEHVVIALGYDGGHDQRGCKICDEGTNAPRN